ncbi:ATP-binding protein [Streptomyces californicus]|uniref:ATP-binding protein n=1 Tax=Streptomyces californicus TaxID=67351 RepID=UPI00296E441A|nr:ATP-binding protein [Streptomyces californicus]MDW4902876.1 ATP-binding protein [Streptomyces californicus]
MPVTTTPRPTGHPGYSETLPREPESAAIARRLVRTALATWGLEDQIDTATVVMTELVSNAVDHGRFASIRVIVSRPTDTRLRLGVVDRSKVLPMMQTHSGPDEIRGRGLLIVDNLTDRWGTDLYRWGKQVWAELRTGVEQ